MMKVLNYTFAALFCAYIMIFTWVICVTPAYSFVGYARVIEKASLEIAKKQAVKEAISIAAAAGGGAAARSLGLRVITAGTGWLGLGIMLGITALQWYYSKDDLNSIYNNSAPSAGWYAPGNSNRLDNTVDNNLGYPTAQYSYPNTVYLCGQEAGSMDWQFRAVRQTAGTDETKAQWLTRVGWTPFASGWSNTQCGSPGAGYVYEWLVHSSSATYNSTDAYQSTGVPTATDITNWLTNNPGHSLSVENKSQAVGYQGAPTPADEVQTINLSSTEISTSLKPASEVTSSDIVLGDGFQAPEGTQTTETQTQTTTSTRTETVTQNPDGSTTTQTQEEETSTATCTAASHSQKTTGTVIQEHINKWQQSGLVAALSGLKNIVWSSTLPTITFTSARWGSHSINMNDWAWVFASVKVVMIAGATLVSYRLVFG